MSKEKSSRHGKVKSVIISIVAAVAIWFVVVYLVNPDVRVTLNNIDVEFLGESQLRQRELVVVDKNKLPEMSVVVSGKRSDLISVIGNVTLQIDLAGITKEGTYERKPDAVVPISGVAVDKIKTDKISVRVEQVISKEIPVRIKQSGVNKEKIIKSETADTIVTISGSKSEVERVQYALVTTDISAVTEDMEQESTFVLMSNDDLALDKNETIETDRPTVVVHHSVYEKKTVPVLAGLSPEADQKYILNMADKSAAPATLEIGVKDFSVDRVYAYFPDQEYTADTLDYDLVLTTPEGAYIPEADRHVKVKAQLIRKATKHMELSVNLLNLGAGLTVNSFDAVVGATLTGPEASLTTDKVKAVADLSGLGVGTYKVAVKFEGDFVAPVENYSITVTIE